MAQPPLSVSETTPTSISNPSSSSSSSTPASSPAPSISYAAHQNVNTSGNSQQQQQPSNSGMNPNSAVNPHMPSQPPFHTHPPRASAPSFSYNFPQNAPPSFAGNQHGQSNTCGGKGLAEQLIWLLCDEMGEGAEYKSGLKKAKVLKALLEDPILADVPKNPTLEDVETLIGLELGSAMRISVLKLDATSFDVILMNTATLKDLKLAIKKKINYMEQSSMGHRHISWRSVWANYCLSFNNNKLLNDHDVLQNLGVRNNSQVHFVPYVMTKESRRHSKRRKHRFFHGLSKLS